MCSKHENELMWNYKNEKNACRCCFLFSDHAVTQVSRHHETSEHNFFMQQQQKNVLKNSIRGEFRHHKKPPSWSSSANELRCCVLAVAREARSLLMAQNIKFEALGRVELDLVCQLSDPFIKYHAENERFVCVLLAFTSHPRQRVKLNDDRNTEKKFPKKLQILMGM